MAQGVLVGVALSCSSELHLLGALRAGNPGGMRRMSLFRRAVTKIGLGLLDLIVLSLGLLYLYFQVTPTDSVVLFTVDAFWLFIIVIILYVATVVVGVLLLSMPGERIFLTTSGIILDPEEV